MTLSFERQRPSEEVQASLSQIMDQLGLSFRIALSDQDHQVTHVQLLDSQGQVCSTGSGKGRDHRIGAFAEAIEHHSLTLDRVALPDRSESLLLDLGEIYQQNILQNDRLIQSLKKFPRASIRCTPFKDLRTSESIYIPAVLSNPNQDHVPLTEAEGFLSRYSTNSGTAFGSSRSEALLHGINEVVERHFLSQLFLSIVDEPDSSIRYIQMPRQDYKVLSNCQMAVWCFHNTIRCAAVFEKHSSRPLSLIGSGASIRWRHAQERAISEFLQVHRLYDEEAIEEDRINQEVLETSPALSRLVHFDFEFSEQDYPVTDHINEDWIHPTSQLQMILEDLPSSQPMLYRTVADFSAAGIVTQVYLPGLDRFNLIRSGSLVAPQRFL